MTVVAVYKGFVVYRRDDGTYYLHILPRGAR